MFQTEICNILGIQYPIVLGGMLWIGRSNLVAAVSEAGGLGLLGAGGMPVEEIEEECRKVREHTDKPFGINIPLVRPDSEEMIAAAMDNGAIVVATSSGSPKKHTSAIQARGGKVIHVVANVTFAKKSEDAGVDIIAAEGYEAGGHNGHDEITTMALIPQVCDALTTPVIAAGGIGDGRGFVAALALGAKGVQLGTRFLATHEASAHDNYKRSVVELSDIGTCVTGRTTVGPTRAIRNNLTEMIVQAERKGAKPEELFEMIGEGRSAKACVEGDCEEGSLYCGQIGGLVREIKSAKDVILDMMMDAEKIIKDMGRMTA